MIATTDNQPLDLSIRSRDRPLDFSQPSPPQRINSGNVIPRQERQDSSLQKMLFNMRIFHFEPPQAHTSLTRFVTDCLSGKIKAHEPMVSISLASNSVASTSAPACPTLVSALSFPTISTVSETSSSLDTASTSSAEPYHPYRLVEYNFGPMKYHEKLDYNSDYQCKLCNQTSDNLFFMKEHFRKKHHNLKFKCPFCAHALTTKYKMTNHIKRHHAIQYYASKNYSQPPEEQRSNNSVLHHA